MGEALQTVARRGGQQHGSEFVGIDGLVILTNSQACQKIYIKIDVVADDGAAPDKVAHFVHHIPDGRRVDHISGADARDGRDARRNVHAGWMSV